MNKNKNNEHDCLFSIGQWLTLLLFGIAGILIIVLCIEFRNSDLIPQLEFQVDSLDITSMIVSNNNNNKRVSGDLDVTLTLKNNRKQELKYFSLMLMSLQYHHHDDELLSSR